MSGLDFGAAVNCQAVIDHARVRFHRRRRARHGVARLRRVRRARATSTPAGSATARPAAAASSTSARTAKKVVFVGTLHVGRARGRGRGRPGARSCRRASTRSSSSASGRSRSAPRTALARGQEVLYVTERCVFRLDATGLALIEVAPGIDLERDILRRLPFAPVVDARRAMDPAVFRPRRCACASGCSTSTSRIACPTTPQPTPSS